VTVPDRPVCSAAWRLQRLADVRRGDPRSSPGAAPPPHRACCWISV